jgi:transposase InsO family protein
MQAREGTVYCCCVLDIFSRRVVGWAIDRRCESILVNDALSMAARTRITSPSTNTYNRFNKQVLLPPVEPSPLDVP